jgi:UDP-N-acetylmuramoyl-tripeptide--D-alanyl-D-alanine ligase
MILSKDLLIQSFVNAKFVCSGKTLDLHEQWDFYNCGKDVAVTIDSRLVKHDDVFVALTGQATDGHVFLKNAVMQGASVFIVHKHDERVSIQLTPDRIGNRLIILVDDTYKALLDLTITWRSRMTFPIIGITGSVGKTSTKELLRSIFQHAGLNFYVSYKNQNTFTGLCINILRVPLNCDVAAFEVGISKPGEMDIKADILRPTIGLITYVAHAHLLDFGTLTNIAYEKRRLFKHFTSQNIGIVCGDQPLLTNVYYTHPIAKFGIKTKNQVQARKIKTVTTDSKIAETEFIFKWYREKKLITMPNHHVGLIRNALAAGAVAYSLKISFDAVCKGIQSYTGFENRFETKKITGNRGLIVSDCYNANPESMRAAILAFDKMVAKGKKIAVLGDMLELGEKENFWHRQIGRLLGKTETIDAVLLVGERSRMIAKTAPSCLTVEWTECWQNAKDKLEALLPEKDSLVLVKASHGMVLNNIVDAVSDNQSYID